MALVHDLLTSLGGAERVLDAFLEIFPQAVIFTLLYDEKKTGGRYKNRQIITSFLQKYRLITGKRDYLLRPFYPAAVEAFDFSDFDLIIADGNAFSKGIIRCPESKFIYYCHSPMGYLWHWKDEYQKEHPQGGRLTSLIFHYLRMWDQLSGQRPDLILANSENVKQRIKKYYQRKAKVLYPPVETEKFQISPKKAGYFLLVSRLSAYKKVNLTIKAFSQLKLPLLIVGTGQEAARLKKLARPYRNIEFKGYVLDSELKNIYSQARAFIFPAEEDFGLAVVEAMSSGTPVIALDKGGSKETVVDGVNGLLFTEQTAASLVSAVKRFLEIEKKFNPEKIRQTALRFDKNIFIKKFRALSD
ncbi:glycosyltransferase [Candidatus Berkelbacteria bacterium]|nr:glycosyltransferase [Candidatus Berkelbacteria bacterium]MBI4029624.1 glycosyltransferase [Candidatus Berkelbacteria bacterium]